jgi:hypothetical protein
MIGITRKTSQIRSTWNFRVSMCCESTPVICDRRELRRPVDDHDLTGVLDAAEMTADPGGGRVRATVPRAAIGRQDTARPSSVPMELSVAFLGSERQADGLGGVFDDVQPFDRIPRGAFDMPDLFAGQGLDRSIKTSKLVCTGIVRCHLQVTRPGSSKIISTISPRTRFKNANDCPTRSTWKLCVSRNSRLVIHSFGAVASRS